MVKYDSLGIFIDNSVLLNKIPLKFYNKNGIKPQGHTGEEIIAVAIAKMYVRRKERRMVVTDLFGQKKGSGSGKKTSKKQNSLLHKAPGPERTCTCKVLVVGAGIRTKTRKIA